MTTKAQAIRLIIVPYSATSSSVASRFTAQTDGTVEFLGYASIGRLVAGTVLAGLGKAVVSPSGPARFRHAIAVDNPAEHRVEHPGLPRGPATVDRDDRPGDIAAGG
jgi:hypothetical protein